MKRQHGATVWHRSVALPGTLLCTMSGMTALSPAPAPWDEAPKRAVQNKVANMLLNAGLTGRPTAPVAELLAPYAAQGAEEVAVMNFRRGLDEGCRVAARAVTMVAAPTGTVGIGGYYFSKYVHAGGVGIPDNLLVAPQVSASPALRVGRTIDRPDATVAEILGAVDGVHAALVVDCPRIGRSSEPSVLEAIADNAHAGHVVVSDLWLPPAGVDISDIVLDVEVGASTALHRVHPWASMHLVEALRRSIALFGPVLPGEILVVPGIGPALPFDPGATATVTVPGFGSVVATHAGGEYDEGFEPLTYAGVGHEFAARGRCG